MKLKLIIREIECIAKPNNDLEISGKPKFQASKTDFFLLFFTVE
ncbi:hypothetical protein OIU77_009102, partial [Salix suchowensis]